MTGLSHLGEALLLGVVSGPACIASCGPVLVPTLLAERNGIRSNTRYLLTFLSTRFVGYLLFAIMAWQLGTLASMTPQSRVLIYGTVHVLLAAALLWYAWSLGRSCRRECPATELVKIGVTDNNFAGAALLGLLTGLSLCPPFVAAGVRAAQLPSAIAALAFFTAFFAGTSIWFVPLLGFSCIRRNEAVMTVARMAMAMIAIYYLILGLTMLVGRSSYDY